MMRLFFVILSVFVTEEILELLPAGVVLGREMGVTSIASVTPVLAAGSRPEWYLLACPREECSRS